MRQSKTKTIDGIQFTVNQLPVMVACKLTPRIARTFAPLISAVPLTGDVANVDAGPPLEAFFELMTGDELEYLITTFKQTAYAVLDGKRWELSDSTGFDAVFDGRLLTLFKFLYFAFEVNYQDFYDVLKGALGTGLKVLASKSKSPST